MRVAHELNQHALLCAARPHAPAQVAQHCRQHRSLSAPHGRRRHPLLPGRRLPRLPYSLLRHRRRRPPARGRHCLPASPLRRRHRRRPQPASLPLLLFLPLRPLLLDAPVTARIHQRARPARRIPLPLLPQLQVPLPLALPQHAVRPERELVHQQQRGQFLAGLAQLRQPLLRKGLKHRARDEQQLAAVARQAVQVLGACGGAAERSARLHMRAPRT